MLNLRLCEYKYPISPKVIETIRRASKKVNEYPVYDELYEALEEYTGYPRENILTHNGSNELITLLSQDLLDKGDKVVVLKPDFPMYRMQALRNDCKLRTVDCFDNGFKPSAEKIIRACRGAKMLWMSNPNNPTGQAIPEQALKKIIRNVNCLVCVDECYYNYYGKTVMPLVGEHDNLIVLRSFSKTHGLAGLRFGFAVSNPEIINETKQYFKFEVNRLAAEAALQAMRDEQHYEHYWRVLSEQRDIVKKELEDLGFRVLDSHTTFLCVNVGDGEALREWLYEQGVQLKVAYDLSGWIRVGVGTEKMNQQFLNVLNKFDNQSLKVSN